MISSLHLLYRLLSTQTLICPSHDYHNEFVTSFEVELARNQLLKKLINQSINDQQFCVQKTQLDKHIIDQSGSEVMCGAYVESSRKKAVTHYTSDTLSHAMTHTPMLKLIDIREPHEYALCHLKTFNHNVPLSRLAQFIKLNQECKDTEVVFVCRSGSRSQVAAQALARLGFNHVGHLAGGYALN